MTGRKGSIQKYTQDKVSKITSRRQKLTNVIRESEQRESQRWNDAHPNQDRNSGGFHNLPRVEPEFAEDNI